MLEKDGICKNIDVNSKKTIDDNLPIAVKKKLKVFPVARNHGDERTPQTNDSKWVKKLATCNTSRNKNTYLEHVEEVFEINGNGLQIVCGDLNTDILNENLGARVLFENMMNSQGLDLVSLREPTRETATSSTCIDAIYSNFSVQPSQILKTTFSDHYSLHLDMSITLELVENVFEFRSLQKLEDPLCCEKFFFF